MLDIIYKKFKERLSSFQHDIFAREVAMPVDFDP